MGLKQSYWNSEIRFSAEPVEEVFETVGLDDVDCFELFTEFSIGKTFLLEPDDIGLG